MVRHRTYSLEFKRRVAQPYLSGEFALAALASQHDLCRSLIGIWAAKCGAGEFDDGSARGGIVACYEARIAELERKVGQRIHGEGVAGEHEEPGDAGGRHDVLCGERPEWL